MAMIDTEHYSRIPTLRLDVMLLTFIECERHVRMNHALSAIRLDGLIDAPDLHRCFDMFA